MKVLIMAAGYAVRLYPLTKDRPKPLLPVCNRPIVDYIVDKVGKIKEIKKMLVVTNNKFVKHFTDWSKSSRFKNKIRIINDGSLSNDDKLGAVGDIDFIIKNAKIEDDLLVVAGDNLFDFELDEFVAFAKSKQPSPSIGLYDVGSMEAVKKYGMVDIDSNKKIIKFEEKPSQPVNTLIAVCVYYFPQETLRLISEYLDEGNNSDAPGYYIDWLYQKRDTYGFIFRGSWYDIGGIASYHQACKDYEKRK